MQHAVADLGTLSQVAVLPGSAHPKNSVLAALVADDPTEPAKLGVE